MRPGHAAREPALPAHLREGEPGRPADHHLRPDQRHAADLPPVGCRRHAAGAAAARSAASAGCWCRAPCGRRCGCRRIRCGWRPMACRWRMCGPPSPRPTSTRRRAASTGRARRTSVMANDQLKEPADFARLIIAWRNGGPVRLPMSAAVQDLENTLNRRLVQWQAGGADRRPAPARRQYRLDRRRDAGAAAALQKALPQGAPLSIVSDRTATIRASVHDVQFTLVLAVALVVAVIFVFLRSLRAPPSSPASPCRCRSSAPSASWRCAASRSTTSRSWR